jgi:hypothetical protein
MILEFEPIEYLRTRDSDDATEFQKNKAKKNFISVCGLKTID